MNILKQLRINAGKLQKDIAAYLGVNRTTYLRYEKGETEPDYQTLRKIADYFNVSVDYLLGRETKKDPSAGEGEKVSSELISLLQDLDPAEEALVRDYVAILKRSRKDQ